MKSVLRKLCFLLAALLVVAAGILYFYLVRGVWGWPNNTTMQGPVPHTPAWALEPWVWEDDVNTRAFVEELLAGYREHDFPIRTILLDSPWSTRYNDFIVDETLYPNPAEFFTGLQDQGYRVVLWMTCMVDSINKDTQIKDATDWWQDAANKGYLAGGDYQFRWWKGKGGFIDYLNPEAMTWWRGMQQQVFDWGIDGWKLDGTDTFFSGKYGPFYMPYGKTKAGWISMRDYMHLYSREEYQHGLTQNPEFITMVRSVDDGIPYMHPWGFAPLDASPVNWVGDQDHAWKVEEEGIEEALRDILKSAKLGYNVVGSDIGGYSGRTIPANLYIRWAQFGAFCPFYLLGGHGERRLWLRTPQELEIIRQYTWLHQELLPYIYTYTTACHHGAEPIIRPLNAPYHYMFGDDLLVAAIHEDSLTRTVQLPPGKWRYFFDDKETIHGPTTITRDFPMDEFPVYIREGAIIPMHIERDYTRIGTADWKDHLVLNLYPDQRTNALGVRHPDDSGITNVGTGYHENGKELRIYLDGVKKPHILRILTEQAPTQITLDGNPLAQGQQWTYDNQDKRLLIRTAEYQTGKYLITF